MSYRWIGILIITTLVGCEQPPKEPPKEVAPAKVAPKKAAPTTEKTKEDARQYLQHHIDVFLGGARTSERAIDAGLPMHAAVHPENVRDIEIVKVLDAYGEDGTRTKDTFDVQLLTTLKSPPIGDDRLELKTQVFIFYTPKTNSWYVGEY